MTRPWYRRFPDNFIGGTVGLTLEEKGAYSLVLDLMYVRGGPIQDEPRYIAGVCNCSVRKWNAIRASLIAVGKIEVVDGCLVNRRAEKEIEIALETSQERAESGSKGGNKSAENRSDTNKNNDLARAKLNHTRAPSTSISNKKNGAIALDPTDGSEKLSRYVHTELFAACEKLTEPVPGFQTAKTWPAEIIAKARENLRAAA